MVSENLSPHDIVAYGQTVRDTRSALSDVYPAALAVQKAAVVTAPQSYAQLVGASASDPDMPSIPTLAQRLRLGPLISAAKRFDAVTWRRSITGKHKSFAQLLREAKNLNRDADRAEALACIAEKLSAIGTRERLKFRGDIWTDIAALNPSALAAEPLAYSFGNLIDWKLGDRPQVVRDCLAQLDRYPKEVWGKPLATLAKQLVYATDPLGEPLVMQELHQSVYSRIRQLANEHPNEWATAMVGFLLQDMSFARGVSRRRGQPMPEVRPEIRADLLKHLRGSGYDQADNATPKVIAVLSWLAHNTLNLGLTRDDWMDISAGLSQEHLTLVRTLSKSLDWLFKGEPRPWQPRNY